MGNSNTKHHPNSTTSSSSTRDESNKENTYSRRHSHNVTSPQQQQQQQQGILQSRKSSQGRKSVNFICSSSSSSSSSAKSSRSSSSRLGIQAPPLPTNIHELQHEQDDNYGFEYSPRESDSDTSSSIEEDLLIRGSGGGMRGKSSLMHRTSPRNSHGTSSSRGSNASGVFRHNDLSKSEHDANSNRMNSSSGIFPNSPFNRRGLNPSFQDGNISTEGGGGDKQQGYNISSCPNTLTHSTSTSTTKTSRYDRMSASKKTMKRSSRSIVHRSNKRNSKYSIKAARAISNVKLMNHHYDDNQNIIQEEDEYENDEYVCNNSVPTSEHITFASSSSSSYPTSTSSSDEMRGGGNSSNSSASGSASGSAHGNAHGSTHGSAHGSAHGASSSIGSSSVGLKRLVLANSDIFEPPPPPYVGEEESNNKAKKLSSSFKRIKRRRFKGGVAKVLKKGFTFIVRRNDKQAKSSKEEKLRERVDSQGSLDVSSSLANDPTSIDGLAQRDALAHYGSSSESDEDDRNTYTGPMTMFGSSHSRSLQYNNHHHQDGGINSNQVGQSHLPPLFSSSSHHEERTFDAPIDLRNIGKLPTILDVSYQSSVNVSQTEDEREVPANLLGPMSKEKEEADTEEADENYLLLDEEEGSPCHFEEDNGQESIVDETVESFKQNDTTYTTSSEPEQTNKSDSVWCAQWDVPEFENDMDKSITISNDSNEREQDKTSSYDATVSENHNYSPAVVIPATRKSSPYPDMAGGAIEIPNLLPKLSREEEDNISPRTTSTGNSWGTQSKIDLLSKPGVILDDSQPDNHHVSSQPIVKDSPLSGREQHMSKNNNITIMENHSSMKDAQQATNGDSVTSISGSQEGKQLPAELLEKLKIKTEIIPQRPGIDKMPSVIHVVNREVPMPSVACSNGRNDVLITVQKKVDNDRKSSGSGKGIYKKPAFSKQALSNGSFLFDQKPPVRVRQTKPAFSNPNEDRLSLVNVEESRRRISSLPGSPRVSIPGDKLDDMKRESLNAKETSLVVYQLPETETSIENKTNGTLGEAAKQWKDNNNNFSVERLEASTIMRKKDSIGQQRVSSSSHSNEHPDNASGGDINEPQRDQESNMIPETEELGLDDSLSLQISKSESIQSDADELRNESEILLELSGEKIIQPDHENAEINDCIASNEETHKEEKQTVTQDSKSLMSKQVDNTVSIHSPRTPTKEQVSDTHSIVSGVSNKNPSTSVNSPQVASKRMSYETHDSLADILDSPSTAFNENRYSAITPMKTNSPYIRFKKAIRRFSNASDAPPLPHQARKTPPKKNASTESFVFSKVTEFNGRLRKNISRSLKKKRRHTSGRDVIAPRRPKLVNPLFRKVETTVEVEELIEESDFGATTDDNDVSIEEDEESSFNTPEKVNAPDDCDKAEDHVGAFDNAIGSPYDEADELDIASPSVYESHEVQGHTSTEISSSIPEQNISSPASYEDSLASEDDAFASLIKGGLSPQASMLSMASSNGAKDIHGSEESSGSINSSKNSDSDSHSESRWSIHTYSKSAIESIPYELHSVADEGGAPRSKHVPTYQTENNPSTDQRDANDATLKNNTKSNKVYTPSGDSLCSFSPPPPLAHSSRAAVNPIKVYGHGDKENDLDCEGSVQDSVCSYSPLPPIPKNGRKINKVKEMPKSPSALCLSPLQRTPVQARKWRTLAAQAEAKKQKKRTPLGSLIN